MKVKVTVILKSGVKQENEYIYNGISCRKEFEEKLKNNLEENSNCICFKDNNSFDFYLKSEIAHMSIEYIN